MDLHAVYAITQPNAAGERAFYRIGRAIPWDAAQDRWNRLDRPRSSGMRRMRIAGEPRPVAYFAVRAISDPDPRWSGAIQVPVKACVAAPDREHTVILRRMPRRKVWPKWTAELSSARGTLRAEGFHPIGATADVRAEARRRGLI